MISVARVVLLELDGLKVAERIAAIESAIAQAVASPTDATEATVQGVLQDFVKALETAPTADAAPSTRAVLRVLQADDITGPRLGETLERTIFLQGGIAARSVSAIQAIRARVKSLRVRVTSLIAFADDLGIATPSERHRPELGVMFPLSLVPEDLGAFHREMKQLNHHVGLLIELLEGTSQAVRLVGLDSDSWDVFIEVGAATAAGLAIAIERIVALYKSSFEIRLLKLQIEEKGLGPQAQQAADDRLREIVREEIESLKQILLDELANGVQPALEYLADRLDRGVDFEVQMPLPSPEAGGTDAAPPHADTDRRALARQGAAVSQLVRHDKPVLSLPQSPSQPETLPFTETPSTEPS